LVQLEATAANLQSANANLRTNLEATSAEKTRLETRLAEITDKCTQSVKCITDIEAINTKNRDRVSREFKLDQGELGIVLSLSDRLFTTEQPTVIASQSLLKLDLLADYLVPLNNQILIETFGQGCGTSAACQAVTETWAQTLAQYLMAQGIPQSRITAVGRGTMGVPQQPPRSRRGAAPAASFSQVKITLRNEPSATGPSQ
jgi:outer membrane protein OmpA-like peptidoglycan-associated protein